MKKLLLSLAVLGCLLGCQKEEIDSTIGHYEFVVHWGDYYDNCQTLLAFTVYEQPREIFNAKTAAQYAQSLNKSFPQPCGKTSYRICKEWRRIGD